MTCFSRAIYLQPNGTTLANNSSFQHTLYITPKSFLRIVYLTLFMSVSIRVSFCFCSRGIPRLPRRLLPRPLRPHRRTRLLSQGPAPHAARHHNNHDHAGRGRAAAAVAVAARAAGRTIHEAVAVSGAAAHSRGRPASCPGTTGQTKTNFLKYALF